MWSMFGYHYPLLLINFRLSQRKKHKECNHRLRPVALDMSRRIFKPTSRDIAGLSTADSVTWIQDAVQSYVAVKSSYGVIRENA